MSMIFIPSWVTNVMLLITCWISGFQLVQMKRANPVTNIQFVMIVFSMLMVLITALYNKTNPWLSLVFFLIAAVNLTVTIRQLRMMPPMKRIE
jgi:hypothetical protein